MKNIFNLNRFVRLFFKFTAEHYKGYLMSLTVLIGVLILGGSFMVYMIEVPVDKSLQLGFFVMILLLSGTIFTSTVFADLGEKKKAVAWLTLPASHFEKYLVGWLYSFLIFIVVYSIIFYLAALFAVNIKHFQGHDGGVINFFDKTVLQIYLLYAFLNGVALYGAIYFEKLHFIKSAFIFFITIAILVFINKMILGALLGRSVEATPPFGDLRFLENGFFIDINVAAKHQTPYLLIFVIVMALIFWVAAYYRLKEKQV